MKNNKSSVVPFFSIAFMLSLFMIMMMFVTVSLATSGGFSSIYLWSWLYVITVIGHLFWFIRAKSMEEAVSATVILFGLVILMYLVQSVY